MSELNSHTEQNETENPNVIDPRKIIGSGFDAIKNVVDSKININN